MRMLSHTEGPFQILCRTISFLGRFNGFDMICASI